MPVEEKLKAVAEEIVYGPALPEVVGDPGYDRGMALGKRVCVEVADRVAVRWG